MWFQVCRPAPCVEQVRFDNTGAANILDDARAAEYLKITPRTLRLWRARRGLPHFKLTPKCIRYSRGDLDGWLARFRTARVAPRTCGGAR